MAQHVAGAGGGVRQQAGLQVHAARDAQQANRAVPDGVEAGHHRQQHLGGADVAGRLLAADVLLARLQRQAQGRVAGGIDAAADQTAGHLPLIGFRGGEECRVRAAEAHRHAEALRAAHDDVGPHLARRGQHDQAQHVRANNRQRAGLVRGVGLHLQRAYGAGGARILQHHGERVGGADGGHIARREIDQCPVQRAGAGFQHGAGLRVQVGRHRDHLAAGARNAVRHGDGFGRRRRLVQQRGVGDRQAGEVGHHRLEVQQRFQPALRDLRLIRRVGGVPAGVLQHVAQDHRRGVGVVVAAADQAFRAAVVLRGQARQLGQHGGLVGGRRQVHRLDAAYAGRNGARHQGVQRLRADHA